MTTLIIAEAGVNHNGSEKLAFDLVDAAVAAGVDIVKFQTFKAKDLVTVNAQQADYQVKNSEKVQTQYQMLKELELSFDSHLAVKSYCEQQGIEYLSTAFDSQSLLFLIETMKLTRLKIPSGEITNAPFVLEHAKSGCDLIVSTGMATLKEIEIALGIIAFGFLNKKSGNKPSLLACKSAYESTQGQQLLKEKVTLLHCTTEYPAPFNEVNLNAMTTMRKVFNLPVGYSDHTAGIVIPVAAVAQKACVIEKHFTLSRQLEGPDHKASIEPNELAQMVKDIRTVELALGNFEKQPTESELKNKAIARKSIVAKVPILKGEKLTSDNLAIMRPGDGLSPINYWKVVDTYAVKDFELGDLIYLSDLS
mgnify:CR=1 FL=1